MNAGTRDYSTRNQAAAADPAQSNLRGKSRRLVVVSNRVTTGAAATSGGLAVALSEALGMSGGLWFGWSGKLRDDCESASPATGR
jgi:trehalose-6-phosphate synthase